MVLNSFYDQRPCVRWETINASGQFSTNLGPNLQVQSHHGVFLSLYAFMDDF